MKAPREIHLRSDNPKAELDPTFLQPLLHSLKTMTHTTGKGDKKHYS